MVKILEHIVSRYHPNFDLATARMGLGQDGSVYLASPGRAAGRTLRVAADGSSPLSGEVGYATVTITAHAAGVSATAEGHYQRRVAFRDAAFNLVGAITDFTQGRP